MRPETQVWLDDAEYDLQSARTMLDAGRYFFVVFMCHLAVEKTLKAIIVERHAIEPPKIHNLVRLATRAGLAVPPEHAPALDELNNMSVVTRYPDGRRALAGTLTPDRARAIYERALELSQWLRKRMQSSPPSNATSQS